MIFLSKKTETIKTYYPDTYFLGYISISFSVNAYENIGIY